MAISKEALSVIESMAYKIHDSELHFLRLSLGREETEELRYFFEGLKAQIGRVFMKHCQTRAQKREVMTTGDAHVMWSVLRDNAGAGPTLIACRFCGSDDLKERPQNAFGSQYWYCNTCRQENRTAEAE